MKKAILIQQQETGRPLLTIICYRLVPLDGSQGVDLTVARPTFFVSWRLIRRKFVLQRFILTTVH